MARTSNNNQHTFNTHQQEQSAQWHEQATIISTLSTHINKNSQHNRCDQYQHHIREQEQSAPPF
ncbi:hypothetical protein HanRHA438_Chr04g0194811 [Helianthus annuus]|nr:hypothetical protein HanRHA438_Chr04g0194811 [Helianthus annuus]